MGKAARHKAKPFGGITSGVSRHFFKGLCADNDLFMGFLPSAETSSSRMTQR
jgi:hypothetical protein